MPTSTFRQLSSVVAMLRLLEPSSVLEVGVGFGKYGVLLRDSLDLEPDENGSYRPWKIQLDGIEVFPQYLTPLHSYIYNKVYTGNALDILPSLGSYDVIMAIDVLEHFTKEEAKQFLFLCRSHARHVFLVTPYVHMDQEEVWNNEYENHRSVWTVADAYKLGASYAWVHKESLFLLFTPDTFSVLPSRQQDIWREDTLASLWMGMQMYHRTEQWKEVTECGRTLLKQFENNPPSSERDQLLHDLHGLLQLSYEKLGNEDRSKKHGRQAEKYKTR